MVDDILVSHGPYTRLNALDSLQHSSYSLEALWADAFIVGALRLVSFVDNKYILQCFGSVLMQT